jgi:DNA processing protein
VSSASSACDACLQRGWLVGRLSGHIETATANSPGRRARELLALPDAELVRFLAPAEVAPIETEVATLDLRRLRARLSADDCWAVCRHRDQYPIALRDDPQAPAALFGRGEARLLERLDADAAVTVVGARRPSGYGREVATGLGRELGAAGLAVVSGMALGIDSCAHRGALEVGGLTVAILGSGPDVPYPARMRRLYAQIVEHGLVLGELPPGARPRRWTFPARNRIMAALGGMTVVVEARERSGSLITSTMASDLGREVGAVPGRVGSSPAAGTNSLLRDGAQLIRCGQDVLDSLLGAGALSRAQVVERPRQDDLDPELASALDAVDQGAETLDAIARSSGGSPQSVAAAVTRLELLGLLRCDSTGRYRRAATPNT